MLSRVSLIDLVVDRLRGTTLSFGKGFCLSLRRVLWGLRLDNMVIWQGILPFITAGALGSEA